jgi:hypothetical protein
METQKKLSKRERTWMYVRQRIKELEEIVPPKTKAQEKMVSESDVVISKISEYFQKNPEAKLVIIGDSMIEKIIIENVLRSIAIPLDRIIFHLQYNFFKKKDIERLYSTDSKNLFVVGPVPHKTKGIENISENLKFIYGDDKVSKALTHSNEFKITKESLKSAVLRMFS